MKAIIKLAFATAIAVFTSSCAKEEKAPVAAAQSNLVTVSYNVDADNLKSSLSGKTVSWTNGDKVNVFDDLGTAGLYGTITDNVLTAQLGAGATKIYVSYPYNANATLSGSTISTTLPSAQKAVAGSFDTNANLCVAWGAADDASLKFLNAGTIVKFELKDSDIKEVKIIGAGNEILTGAADIALSGESSAAGSIVATPDASKGSAYAVLNGSFSTGSEYALCVLPQNLPNGINIVLTNTASKLATKAVSNALQLKRNVPVNFGSFGGYTFSNDLYTLYNNGMPIDVAGKIYRKSVDGAALEAVADGAVKGYEWFLMNRNAPIVFLREANGGTFGNTNSNLTTSTEAMGSRSDYVAVSRYSDTPITIADIDANSAGTTYVTKLVKGSVRFKNIIFDLTKGTNNYMFNNQGATENYKALHFDGCTFKLGGTQGLYYRNVTDKSIESIKFVGCTFLCDALSSNRTIINTDPAAAAEFKEIVFDNNVVCASAYNQYLQTMVSTYKSGVSGTGTTSLSVKNNIFYNTFGGNQMFKIGAVAGPVDVEGNIFYYTGAPASATITFCQFYNPDQTAADLTVGNNLYYTTSTVRTPRMIWSSGSTISYPAENELSKYSTSPFTAFDATTGEYTMASGFEMYGPKVKE